MLRSPSSTAFIGSSLTTCRCLLAPSALATTSTRSLATCRPLNCASTLRFFSGTGTSMADWTSSSGMPIPLTSGVASIRTPSTRTSTRPIATLQHAEQLSTRSWPMGGANASTGRPSSSAGSPARPRVTARSFPSAPRRRHCGGRSTGTASSSGHCGSASSRSSGRSARSSISASTASPYAAAPRGTKRTSCCSASLLNTIALANILRLPPARQSWPSCDLKRRGCLPWTSSGCLPRPGSPAAPRGPKAWRPKYSARVLKGGLSRHSSMVFNRFLAVSRSSSGIAELLHQRLAASLAT
mmetsp:Transcript_20461/g.53729  ORF Transcript_20461/g.53729 Transcript_20461/m.53729 type:complete len:298 (-) Transcript_20461:418-1311(-)